MVKELIEKGNYKEALRLIGSKDDELSLYQKAACLYGLNKKEAALETCKEGVVKSSKLYYDFLALELSLLLELEQEEEALSILEEELSMPYIPSKYETVFSDIYEKLLKNKRAEEKSYSPFDLLSSEELKELLKPHQSPEILLTAIYQLEKRNVRLFMDVALPFLESEAPNYLKTAMLEVLSNQKIDLNLRLKKGCFELEINPKDLKPLMQQEALKSLEAYIREFNKPKDVSVNQDAYDLLISYLADLYPLEVGEDEYKYLAAALYYAAISNYQEDYDLETLAEEEHLKIELIQAYYDKIVNLPSIF